MPRPYLQSTKNEPMTSELISWQVGGGLCRARRFKWLFGDAYLSLGEMETRGLKQP